MTLTKSVTLNPAQSQGVSFEVRPQEAGVYQVSVNGLTGSFTAVEEAPPGLIGDLNDDGVINALDLTLLERYITGLSVETPLSDAELRRRADVNGDGAINSLDVTALEALISPVPPVVTYHLDVYIIGNGTVTPGSDDYDAGTTVTLIAIPDTGAVFDHWSGDATGTSPTTNIVMDRDKEVTAHFKAAPVINYSGKRAWGALRIWHELPGAEATTWVVTETTGHIGNLLVELTKAGLAGMETTFKIRTGQETNLEFITLEVLGWWQWGRYLTGITIYDYNYTPPRATSKKIDIDAGEMLRYTVSVIPGGVLTKIWNSADKLIFEYLYECDAKRIVRFQTELEYWRYYEVIDGEFIIREGRFDFAGEVTLEQLYREGVGWVNAADVLSFPGPSYSEVVGIVDPRVLFSYDHYKQDGYIIFKGEVNDG